MLPPAIETIRIKSIEQSVAVIFRFCTLISIAGVYRVRAGIDEGRLNVVVLPCETAQNEPLFERTIGLGGSTATPVDLQALLIMLGKYLPRMEGL